MLKESEAKSPIAKLSRDRYSVKRGNHFSEQRAFAPVPEGTMKDVYAEAEAKIRQILIARPQARGRGKSPAFIDKAARIGIWILRKHGPYGARIFSACREVLKK